MKFSSLPHTLLMVRPAFFGFNKETASTNFFQSESGDADADKIHRNAIREFDNMVTILRAHDIDVIVVDDIGKPKPDAIFPNNWISTHEDGKLVVYPMMSESRRDERREDIVELLRDKFATTELIDLSVHEQEGRYLEGTGSLVFDHRNKIVYASISPRTDASLVTLLATKLHYKPIIFHAKDEVDHAVYHTNVVLSIGSSFAVICLDAIPDENEQEILLEQLNASERKIIAISFAQMQSFAGNIFEVLTSHDQQVVVMSERAFNSLLPGQINAIGDLAEIVTVNVDTIEKAGGGSVRCMIADIYLPKTK